MLEQSPGDHGDGGNNQNALDFQWLGGGDGEGGEEDDDTGNGFGGGAENFLVAQGIAELIMGEGDAAGLADTACGLVRATALAAEVKVRDGLTR